MTLWTFCLSTRERSTTTWRCSSRQGFNLTYGYRTKLRIWIQFNPCCEPWSGLILVADLDPVGSSMRIWIRLDPRYGYWSGWILVADLYPAVSSLRIWIRLDPSCEPWSGLILVAELDPDGSSLQTLIRFNPRCGTGFGWLHVAYLDSVRILCRIRICIKAIAMIQNCILIRIIENSRTGIEIKIPATLVNRVKFVPAYPTAIEVHCREMRRFIYPRELNLML